MRWLRLLGPVAFVAVGIASCKSNTISNSNSSSATIGPSGGVVPGPDGAELRVPGGALTQNVAFSMRVAEPGEYPQPAPSGGPNGNKVYAIEPHGQEFLSPATVVIPFTQQGAPSIERAEPGDTGWLPLQVTGNKPNALEATVSQLSFFYVPGPVGGGGPDAGACSGRGPVVQTPSSSITGTSGSGTIPGSYFASGGNPTPLDGTTLQSGFAYMAMGGTNFAINLADFANSCGYAENNDYKLGGSTLTIMLTQSGTPSAGTFAPSQLRAGGSQVPTNSPTTCAQNANAMNAPSSGTGLTISTIDQVHVTGNYDVFVGTPATEVKGTFDVPLCTQNTSLTPACCVN
jgi:hypothetical protein